MAESGLLGGFVFASDDISTVVDFLEFDRDLAGNTAFLHGDAIDHVCSGHRLFAVRYDDELGAIEELF